MNTTLTPNLMTEDVNQSVIFYRDRLGFRYLMGLLSEGDAMAQDFDPDKTLQWAMLERDGAQVMFQLRDSMAREYAEMNNVAIGSSATFYLEVPDLDNLISGLGNGIETVLPDHTTFYGMRELWIRDNNGYLLALAEKPHQD
jgi:uncharacterized glyoxalase superfamily protein PhnB